MSISPSLESDHLAIDLVKSIINKLSDGQGGPI
jgi:hypothetical protein